MWRWLFLIIYFVGESSGSSGIQWSSAVVVDNRGLNFTVNGLRDIDDKLAVAYSDPTGFSLVKIASDLNATIWPGSATLAAPTTNEFLALVENSLGAPEPVAFVYTRDGSVHFEPKFGTDALVHDAIATGVQMKGLAVYDDCGSDIPCMVLHNASSVYFDRASSPGGSGWNQTFLNRVYASTTSSIEKVFIHDYGNNVKRLFAIIQEQYAPWSPSLFAATCSIMAIIADGEEGFNWDPTPVLIDSWMGQCKGLDSASLKTSNSFAGDEVELMYEKSGSLYFVTPQNRNLHNWRTPRLVVSDVDATEIGLVGTDVGEDGTAIAAYVSADNRIHAVHSTDVGRTWSTPSLAYQGSSGVLNRAVLIEEIEDTAYIAFTQPDTGNVVVVRALEDPAPTFAPPTTPPATNNRLTCPGSICTCDATACRINRDTNIAAGEELVVGVNVNTLVEGDLVLAGKLIFETPTTLIASGNVTFVSNSSSIDYTLFVTPVTDLTPTTSIIEASGIQGQAGQVSILSSDPCTTVTSSELTYSSSTLQVTGFGTKSSCPEGLSAGAIVGIAIGCVIFGGIGFAVCVYVFREREKALKKARFLQKTGSLSSPNMNNQLHATHALGLVPQ